MKKVLSIAAVALFSIGLFSCEAENTADQEELYIDSTDDQKEDNGSSFG